MKLRCLGVHKIACLGVFKLSDARQIVRGYTTIYGGYVLKFHGGTVRFLEVRREEPIFHSFASVLHKQQKDTANQVAVHRLPSVLVRHAED
jgi:hypothetical protein